MDRSWVERQANSLDTPLPFALWFVQEGVKTYSDVDDALVEYFKSKGVEQAEELDDTITLQAGVQRTRFRTPLWFQLFADNVGFEIEDWFIAVCELLRLSAQDWSDAQDEG